MGVKIVIEREANPRLAPGDLQNTDVLRALHAHLGYMHRVESLLTEDSCGLGSQSLIEQKPSHATRSMPRLSSSTAAAA